MREICSNIGPIWLKASITKSLITYNSCLDKFELEHVEPGLAVDLGCGNSFLVSELLKRGWEVIAIDNSIEALGRLAKRIERTIPEKRNNLTYIISDIETCPIPNGVRFLVAKDSLPYSNPLK